MKINKKLLANIFNKWTLPFAFFLVYIIFNNENGILVTQKLKSELHNLKKQELYLKQKIVQDKQRINELQSNQKNLEKFAREQFYMHKDNEDVFIVVEDDD
ncbi:MAG: FtsB family cell division protein [Mangrovibacterium sp.]